MSKLAPPVQESDPSSDASMSDGTDDEAALQKVLDLLGEEGVDAYEFGSEDDDASVQEDIESEGSESEDEEDQVFAQAAAMDRVLETFKLDASFWDTQTLTYPEDLVIPDAGNDLDREIQFYKQAIWGANEGRSRFQLAGKPFARPDDYFAEMVKSDTHMERIRQRLLDESASLKASDEAKRLRHLKKFGKQVQVAKIQERQKAKKQIEQKVKDFRSKRKGNEGEGPTNDDQFGISLEKDERPTKKVRFGANKGDAKGKGGQAGKARMPRDARNSKYGRPQTSRRPKSNTKESTEEMFAKPKAARKLGGKMGGKKAGAKGAKQRPGKARRAAGRS